MANVPRLDILAIGLLSFMLINGTLNMAHASDGQWQVNKISGKAWIEVPNREKMRVTRHRILFPGQILLTGKRTRLQLGNGKQRIQVGSNSILSLPTMRESKPGHTKIYLRSGTTHLTVDKRHIKHFSVETPFMVAAVKGTTFTVSLDETQAQVRVHEGLVEVQNRTTDQRVDVRAGQSVAMKIAAFNRHSTSDFKIGPAAKPALMHFYERGEEHPETVRKRAGTAQNRSDLQGIAGDVSSMATGVATGFVAHVFAQIDAIILASTHVVASAAQTVMSFLDNKMRDIHNWRVWLIVGLAVAACGAMIGYWIYRRKRYRIDLSRSGI